MRLSCLADHPDRELAKAREAALRNCRLTARSRSIAKSQSAPGIKGPQARTPDQ